jgi:hypothetical protein
MANPDQLEILQQGVEGWNKWKRKHPRTKPDLEGADLEGADLEGIDLSGANISLAYFSGANLSGANLADTRISATDLSGANLSGANISEARLIHTDLSGANLSGAQFGFVELIGANLCHASLDGAGLYHVDFTGAKTSGTRIHNSILSASLFALIDLRGFEGLETVTHWSPSLISVDTIYESEGEIPEAFLVGCGVPDSFIIQIPALVAAMQPIQFYSCFISYNHKDEEFARRLFSRMREAGLRVWYAPKEMKAGRKLHEQIFRAIQFHDKLLIVLSQNSLQSEWVMTEIRRAKKNEKEENRRKLFPIRLVHFDTIYEWECFDADSGKDLAVDVREYFIPDFSNWKDPNAFEMAFEHLLRDLKAGE